MKVLVIGGGGSIGSHTVVQLLNVGHEGIIVNDASNAKADAMGCIKTIAGKRL